MAERQEVFEVLANALQQPVKMAVRDIFKLQEIRLRVNRPLSVIYDNVQWFVTRQGRMTKRACEALIVSDQAVKESFARAGKYSMYACEEDVKNGYITIRGGHRIGVAGKMVVQGGEIVLMKHISFMNIRLAHQYIGCAKLLYPYIFGEHGVCSTLLIAPPRAGKTTMLRDLIRLLSEGDGELGYTVGVVDERSELAACYMGVPQNDLGPRTDVLDCCPKSEGMLMLLRSMSPQVIAVDEIGSSKDMEALRYATNAGCAILSTIHGISMEDVRTRPIVQNIVEQHLFQRYILLGTGEQLGQIASIYDERGQCIYCAE